MTWNSLSQATDHNDTLLKSQLCNFIKIYLLIRTWFKCSYSQNVQVVYAVFVTQIYNSLLLAECFRQNIRCNDKQ